MICHRLLADRLSFMDLTTVSLSLFLVDCRIKSTGTLIDLKASFPGPALELSRSPRPRVFRINTLLARLVGLDSKSEMAPEKQSSPSTGKSTDLQNKPPYPTGVDVHEGNIIPISLDKLSAEHRQELEQMMSSVKDNFMNSFDETRQGTVVQKYKLKVVATDEASSSTTQEDKGIAGESGDKGGGFQEGMVEDLGPNGNGLQPQFNNFQDRIDYVVQHALINQSGVLVNTLTNMVKSGVDGKIAEHQVTGPVYLPGGVFPNYRPLVTGNQQGSSSAPPTQSMAPAAASAPAAQVAPSLAPGQITNPRLLTREQPQHGGQNINRLTQEKVAAMFYPNQPTADLALPNQHTSAANLAKCIG